MRDFKLFHSEKQAKRYMKYLTKNQILGYIEVVIDETGKKVWKVTEM